MAKQINKFVLYIAAGIVGAAIIAAAFVVLRGEKDIGCAKAGQRVVSLVQQNDSSIEVSLLEAKKQSGLCALSLKINQEEVKAYASKDGKLLFPQGIDIDQELERIGQGKEQQREQASKTIGNFVKTEDELCLEDGKPIVYFFGSSRCPHCQWEHPIAQKVFDKFGDLISLHDNMDASGVDSEVFARYGDGGIPTIVMGCRYYRVGSGEAIGEEQEERVLTALTCKLIQDQPEDVCDGVRDLIDQI
jgi:thiol-disulfide isomerase/thioredoxin